jgi:hypothetical protein
MSSAGVSVFSEPDLIDLLAEEPELLAFADAIAETQPVRQGRLSRRSLRVALVVAASAATVAVALVGPGARGREPSLVDRALAAVGHGPVIHAVIQDRTGATYVDLTSGGETPQLRTVEIWFDRRRGLEHTITRIEGRLQDDMLQTPAGGMTSSGPIYTCAWIKAHPQDAAKVGVSCDANASSAPQAPALDPALADFVDGYRNALQNGGAQPLGDGVVNGRAVSWLQLTLADGRTERVAIDKQTSEPVRVETSSTDGARWSYDVLSIEAVGVGSGNFAAPKPDSTPAPSGGSVRESTPITPGAAAATLPHVFSAGAAVDGLRLASVLRATLITGYGPLSNKPPTSSTGVEFNYGDGTPAGGRYVWLMEATRPELAYRWFPGDTPKPGTILINGFGGYLVQNGVYITIAASDHELILTAAHALEAVAPS